MDTIVSKSRFKANARRYFREVETTARPITITDRGRPVLRIVPFAPLAEDPLESLRGTVLRYDSPLEPVAGEDWEPLR